MHKSTTLRQGPVPLIARGPLFISLCFYLAVLLGIVLGLSLMAMSISKGSIDIDIYARVISKTFRTAAEVTLICLPLAATTAIAIRFSLPRYRYILLLLVSIPLFLSILVDCFGWQILLAREGVLASIFHKINL